MKWEMVELESITLFIRNGVSIKQFEGAGGTPITRIETISNGTIDIKRVGYAGVLAEDYNDKLLKKGDILLSHINSLEHLGKTAKYDGSPSELIHGMNLVGLRPLTEKVLPQFMLYALKNKNFKAQILKYANQSVNQSSISVTNLKQLQIPLPPLAEQQRIAEILDKADALREQRKQAIALLDKLLQSVFLDMFGDPVTNPMEWEEKTIGDLTDVLTGATPSRKINEFYNGDVPWVKTTEVNGNDIYHTEEHITRQAINESNCKIVPINSIILAMYGQGKTRGQVSRLKVSATTNQACAVILPTTKVHSNYLYYFLTFSYSQLRALGRGGNQPNLNLSLVRSFLINIPPSKLQNQFAHIVEKIEAQKALQQAQLKQLDNLFGCLQQKAFSGEL